MVRIKAKNILLLLSLIVLVVGFVIVTLTPPRTLEKPIKDAYRLIPSSIEAVAEVQDAPNLYSMYNLLFDEEIQDLSSFSHTLYKLLKKSSASLSSFLVLSNNLKNLDDGLIILPMTKSNELWVQSYLNEVKQPNQPKRMVEYRGFDIYIYPLTYGSFFSSASVAGFLVLSNQLSNLYTVIDASYEQNKSTITTSALNGEISKSTTATLYTKKIPDSKWMQSYLICDGMDLTLLRETTNDNDQSIIQNEANREAKVIYKDIFQDIPKGTFAMAHYTKIQLQQNYDACRANLPLSANEEEWYNVSKQLIDSGLHTGMYSYRIQDSIVSSNVILKSVDSLFRDAIKELEFENSRLIRRLLREETTYYSPHIFAIPSPAWLNDTFEISRDRRVLYIGALSATNTLMSWDFNLLSTYIQSCKKQYSSSETQLNEVILSPRDYFYFGDLQEVGKDTLINHNDIPPFIKTRLSKLSSFYYIDQIFPSDAGFYRMQRLKSKD